jgi:hypothetical protein
VSTDGAGDGPGWSSVYAFNTIGLGLLAFAGMPAMVVAAYVFVQAWQ